MIKINKTQNVNKYIYWIPRILSILFICFLTLFSLDVFSMNLGFLEAIGAFFMHSIPSIVLAIILAISWKYEIIGGIIFILAGISYTSLLVITMIRSGFLWSYLFWILQISGIAFLIGTLFLIGWWKKINK
jgi:hypothetical protein